MSHQTLRWTLLGDGSSDESLQPIITWTLVKLLPSGSHLEPGFVSHTDLGERLRRAQQEFPSDLFFVHRDAEKERAEQRLSEIEKATATISQLPPTVPIIPVRMTEAWLLIDEGAIRMAADNPNGRRVLSLPGIAKLEALPDPKDVLDQCLMTANDSQGRRHHKFKRSLPFRRRRVSQLIRDFRPLRSLSAFRRFEQDTRVAIESWLAARS